MDWQNQLISIYLNVCDAREKGLFLAGMRHSNNSKPVLTDEEVVTIYVFGNIMGNASVREIFNYLDRHLRDWFPELKNYEAFNYRLLRLEDVFVALSNHFSADCPDAELEHQSALVVDSFPIVMAGPKRSRNAKVARHLAAKGYCASKDLYFYGVKLHCLAKLRPGTIPLLTHLGAAPANVNDQTMFEMVSPEIKNCTIYGDKAYID